MTLRSPALVMMISQAQSGDRLMCADGAWETLETVKRLSLHVVQVTTASGETFALEDRQVVIGRDRESQ